MRVFEMESSKNGNYFLAAEIEKKVAAYESATGRKLGEYTTHFEGGGKRMCIADSGKYFAAAAYGRFGITLYDTENGNALWTTKEVKRIQRICFSPDDTKLFVINNDDCLYTISTTDGSIISVEKGIKKIFPDNALEVKLTSSESVTWSGGSADFTDRLLSIYSGNGMIFCSIIGGGLKCFSESGNELWSAKNKFEEHYIKLGYCPKHGYITGLGFKFGGERKAPIYFLDVFSTESGNMVYSVGLYDETAGFTFIENAEKVVSGSGNVYTLEKDNFTVKEKMFDI